MEDVQSWWEVPSVAHFCSLFRAAFDLLDFDIEELEEAILTDGLDSAGSPLLAELLVRLVRGCLPNRHVSQANLDTYLRKLFKIKAKSPCCHKNLFKGGEFRTLTLRRKVQILHALCDFRLEAEDVLDLLKNLETESLRVEPLGYDDSGATYWYFYGTRLYREDNSLMHPIRRRNKIEKRDLEEEDDLRPTWQVQCFTEEDWVKLSLKFKGCESRLEKCLLQTLKDDFLPEIPRLFDEKEKIQQKRLLEMPQRRSSNRVQKLREKKDENTGKSGMGISETVKSRTGMSSEESEMEDNIHKEEMSNINNEERIKELDARLRGEDYGKDNLINVRERKKRKSTKENRKSLSNTPDYNNDNSDVSNRDRKRSKRKSKEDLSLFDKRKERWRDSDADSIDLNSARVPEGHLINSLDPPKPIISDACDLLDVQIKTERPDTPDPMQSELPDSPSSMQDIPDSQNHSDGDDQLNHSLENVNQSESPIHDSDDTQKKYQLSPGSHSLQNINQSNSSVHDGDTQKELSDQSRPGSPDSKTSSEKKDKRTVKKKSPIKKLKTKKKNKVDLKSDASNKENRCLRNHKYDPPPPPQVYCGRKTNNSLSSLAFSLTPSTVVPESSTQPAPSPPTKKRVKSCHMLLQTEDDLRTGMYKVLEHLRDDDDSWPFLDPVDDSFAPNYYAVIRRPMYITRMESRVESGFYTSLANFEADFKLMMDNCKLYNGPESEYTHIAYKLEKTFSKLKSKFLQIEFSSDDETYIEIGYQNSIKKRKNSTESKFKAEKTESDSELKSTGSTVINTHKKRRKSTYESTNKSTKSISKESVEEKAPVKKRGRPRIKVEVEETKQEKKKRGRPKLKKENEDEKIKKENSEFEGEEKEQKGSERNQRNSGRNQKNNEKTQRDSEITHSNSERNQSYSERNQSYSERNQNYSEIYNSDDDDYSEPPLLVREDPYPDSDHSLNEDRESPLFEKSQTRSSIKSPSRSKSPIEHLRSPDRACKVLASRKVQKERKEVNKKESKSKQISKLSKRDSKVSKRKESKEKNEKVSIKKEKYDNKSRKISTIIDKISDSDSEPEGILLYYNNDNNDSSGDSDGQTSMQDTKIESDNEEFEEDKPRIKQESLDDAEEKIYENEKELHKDEAIVRKNEEKVDRNKETMHRNEEKMHKNEEKVRRNEEKMRRNEENIHKNDKEIYKNEEINDKQRIIEEEAYERKKINERHTELFGEIDDLDEQVIEKDKRKRQDKKERRKHRRHSMDKHSDKHKHRKSKAHHKRFSENSPIHRDMFSKDFSAKYYSKKYSRETSVLGSHGSDEELTPTQPGSDYDSRHHLDSRHMDSHEKRKEKRRKKHERHNKKRKSSKEEKHKSKEKRKKKRKEIPIDKLNALSAATEQTLKDITSLLDDPEVPKFRVESPGILPSRDHDSEYESFAVKIEAEYRRKLKNTDTPAAKKKQHKKKKKEQKPDENIKTVQVEKIVKKENFVDTDGYREMTEKERELINEGLLDNTRELFKDIKDGKIKPGAIIKSKDIAKKEGVVKKEPKPPAEKTKAKQNPFGKINKQENTKLGTLIAKAKESRIGLVPNSEVHDSPKLSLGSIIMFGDIGSRKQSPKDPNSSDYCDTPKRNDCSDTPRRNSKEYTPKEHNSRDSRELNTSRNSRNSNSRKHSARETSSGDEEDVLSVGKSSEHEKLDSPFENRWEKNYSEMDENEFSNPPSYQREEEVASEVKVEVESTAASPAYSERNDELMEPPTSSLFGDFKQERATPNLSAWFKAFGGPKHTPRRNEEDFDDETKREKDEDLDLRPFSPMEAKLEPPPQTPMSILPIHSPEPPPISPEKPPETPWFEKQKEEEPIWKKNKTEEDDEDAYKFEEEELDRAREEAKKLERQRKASVSSSDPSPLHPSPLHIDSDKSPAAFSSEGERSPLTKSPATKSPLTPGFGTPKQFSPVTEKSPSVANVTAYSPRFDGLVKGYTSYDDKKYQGSSSLKVGFYQDMTDKSQQDKNDTQKIKESPIYSPTVPYVSPLYSNKELAKQKSPAFSSNYYSSVDSAGLDKPPKTPGYYAGSNPSTPSDKPSPATPGEEQPKPSPYNYYNYDPKQSLTDQFNKSMGPTSASVPNQYKNSCATPHVGDQYKSSGHTSHINEQYKSSGPAPHINDQYKNTGLTSHINDQYKSGVSTPHISDQYKSSISTPSQISIMQSNSNQYSKGSPSTGAIHGQGQCKNQSRGAHESQYKGQNVTDQYKNSPNPNSASVADPYKNTGQTPKSYYSNMQTGMNQMFKEKNANQLAAGDVADISLIPVSKASSNSSKDSQHHKKRLQHEKQIMDNGLFSSWDKREDWEKTLNSAAFKNPFSPHSLPANLANLSHIVSRIPDSVSSETINSAKKAGSNASDISQPYLSKSMHPHLMDGAQISPAPSISDLNSTLPDISNTAAHIGTTTKPMVPPAAHQNPVEIERSSSRNMPPPPVGDKSHYLHQKTMWSSSLPCSIPSSLSNLVSSATMAALAGQKGLASFASDHLAAQFGMDRAALASFSRNSLQNESSSRSSSQSGSSRNSSQTSSQLFHHDFLTRNSSQNQMSSNTQSMQSVAAQSHSAQSNQSSATHSKSVSSSNNIASGNQSGSSSSDAMGTFDLNLARSYASMMNANQNSALFRNDSASNFMTSSQELGAALGMSATSKTPTPAHQQSLSQSNFGNLSRDSSIPIPNLNISGNQSQALNHLNAGSLASYSSRDSLALMGQAGRTLGVEPTPQQLYQQYLQRHNQLAQEELLLRSAGAHSAQLHQSMMLQQGLMSAAAAAYPNGYPPGFSLRPGPYQGMTRPWL